MTSTDLTKHRLQHRHCEACGGTGEVSDGLGVKRPCTASVPTKGFAALSADQRREMGRLGGRSAHVKGTAYQFTPEKAREVGIKGGIATSQDKEHMSAIGKIGGKAKGTHAERKAKALDPSIAALIHIPDKQPEFGNWLKAHREANGITREVLSAESGVSWSAITCIERGMAWGNDRTPKLLIEALAAISLPKRGSKDAESCS